MQPVTARYGSTITITMDVLYSIDTNIDPPLPFDARKRRLVVHGGGWGIGTFQQRIPSIESAGYGLDVVCYAESEAATFSAGRRYFMDDPTWRTWHRNRVGEHTFPPFGEIFPSEPVAFAAQIGCNGLHRIIRGAMGIVSKPGAGTLIDSFGSATPLIMLEPFGPHEERNCAGVARLSVRCPVSRLGRRRVPRIDVGGSAPQFDCA